MARLPEPGGDAGNWGEILNDFLRQEHNNDGTLKNVARKDDVTIKPGESTGQAVAGIALKHPTDPDRHVETWLGTTADGGPTLYAIAKLNAAGVVSGDGGAVDSVNGKTGAVMLDASDVGALPADAKLPERPAVRGALLHPERLSRWYARIERAAHEPVTIAAIGDSITQGYNASPRYLDGWVPLLRRRFARRFVEPGEGAVMMIDSRISHSGVTASGFTAPHGAAWSLASGASITITTPVCTAITVHGYYQNDAASGAFGAMIDGVDVGPLTVPTSTTNTPYTATINALGEATHALVLSGPATGTAILTHLTCYRDTTAGVRVQRYGVAGATTTLIDNATRRAQMMDGTDLVILWFGANDMAGNPQSRTPAQLAASLADAVTYVTDTVGAAALVVIGNHPTAPHIDLDATYAPDDYWDAVVGALDAMAHCAILDLRVVLGATYAEQDPYIADSVHLNEAGHQRIATAIFDGIAGHAVVTGLFGAAPDALPSALTPEDRGTISSGDATTDAVIANLRTRVDELETVLQQVGVLPPKV